MNAASGEFPTSEGSDSWPADDTPRLDDYLRGQVRRFVSHIKPPVFLFFFRGRKEIEQANVGILVLLVQALFTLKREVSIHYSLAKGKAGNIDNLRLPVLSRAYGRYWGIVISLRPDRSH